MGFYDWDRMKPEEVTDLYLRKVVAGESIAVARIEVKEGAVTLPHNHDSEEVIIVLSGAWRFQLSGRVGAHISSATVSSRASDECSTPAGIQSIWFAESITFRPDN